MAGSGVAAASQEVADALAGLAEAGRRMCAASLRSIGAGPGLLPDDQRQRLDRDGFTVLPGVLGPDEVAAINARVDEAEVESRRLAASCPPGAFLRTAAFWWRETVLKDLLNSGPAFDVAFSHPLVMAGLGYLLDGDLKLSYLHMRQPVPGAGQQDMHLDTHEFPVVPDAHYVAGSIWMLDDFTPDNGSTRFVPGSHRLGYGPDAVMPDLYADHPRQVHATGKAGSVIVYDGHTWHGGTTNHSGARRRALLSLWVHRRSYPLDDQRKLIHPETYDRLDDAQRFLLDVHGVQPLEPPDPYQHYLVAARGADDDSHG